MKKTIQIKPMLLGFLMVFALMMLSPEKASAQLKESAELNQETTVKFCNNTDQREIHLAIGYKSSDDISKGWISRGWFAVQSRKCLTLSLGKGYRGYAYAYAISQNKVVEWSGCHYFYVDQRNNSFRTLQDNPNLKDHPNYELVGMNEFKVKPGVNTYNFGYL